MEAPAVPAGVQLGQVPRWVANAGLRWQGTPDLQLSLDVKAFPDFWYNTAHTTMNTGAVILDAGFVYRLRPAVEIYGSVLNLGSRSYYDQGLG
ncbi:TonB-dependent receptor, partial [Acinetobacter baumannii]|nr:TonB-dependent receptor [Acinetobacter baumannii]